MTITEFLEARLSEDEALANATIEDQSKRGWGDWREESLAEGGGLPAGDLTAEFSPARVLAECAAKRAIIRRYQSYYASRHTCSGNPAYHSALGELGFAVSTLAAVYASHPDYDPRWAA